MFTVVSRSFRSGKEQRATSLVLEKSFRPWLAGCAQLTLATGQVFCEIFFEDVFLGYFRQIFFDKRPAPKHEFPAEDPGQGDSFGHWEGDTLVVDTTNFNEYIWLNSKWAPHSDALHLIERYRLVGGGQYLEVKVTAEDPNVLAKPYTYTRYFQKVNVELPQYLCTDDLVKPAIPNLE